MKTKFFKTVLPFLAVVLAITGAFAFNQVPKEAALVDIYGVIPQGDECEDTNVLCTTINTGSFCTQGSSTLLYRMNAAGTACPEQLYKKN